MQAGIKSIDFTYLRSKILFYKHHYTTSISIGQGFDEKKLDVFAIFFDFFAFQREHGTNVDFLPAHEYRLTCSIIFVILPLYDAQKTSQLPPRG